MDSVDNLAGGGGSPHDRSMEARVAVLEEIAAATKGALVGLRQEAFDTNHRMDMLREDMRRELTGLRRDVERDFRLMFSAIIAVALGLAALMANGFHWF